MAQATPAFLFTFANDSVGSLDLRGEWRSIRDKVKYPHDKGAIQYEMVPGANLDDLWDSFDRFNDRLTLFHFGGHSGEDSLHLTDLKLQGKNLATVLGLSPNLKLVFLNGCSNYPQVQALHDAGVPAVIATEAPINDGRAIELAEKFYQALVAGRSLGEAFKVAAAVINNQEAGLVQNRSKSFRDLLGLEEGPSSQLSWGLYLKPGQEEVMDWKIPKEPVGPEVVPPIPKRLTNIPGPVNDFTGRAHDLQQIHETLKDNRSLLLLNGIGGMGKTTLAREYVHQFQDQYEHLLWISVQQDAEQPELQSASSALANNVQLFQNLGLEFNTDLSEADRLALVLNQLKSLEGRRKLLVVDNAGKSLEEIRSQLPQPPDWHVLVTSRIQLNGLAIQKLNELPTTEAEALFLKLYPKGQPGDPDILDLLKEIGYHTLTLELLARTCKGFMTPAKLLQQIREQRFHALSRRAWSEHSDSEQNIYAYLLAIFDVIGLSEPAQNILRQWSIIPSEEIVPEQLLQVFSVDEDEVDSFERALLELVDFGWISHNEEGDTYRCHQLIQEVARTHLKPNKSNCEPIIKGVRRLLSLDQSKDNPIDKFPWVPWGESLLLWLKLDTSELNILKNNLATVYQDLGRYTEACSLFEEVLRSIERNFGVEHPNTATSRSNLALVYKDLGRYTEAAELLEETLKSDEKNLGSEHPSTARSRSNLAVAYQALGRYSEATSLLEEAIRSAEKNFGPEHSSTARSRSILAAVYQDLGRYKEAASLLEEALRSAEKNFGPEHPSTATRRSNLATAYQALGKYSEAASLLEEALRSDEKNFGPEHPSTARSRNNLASIYQDLGRYTEAASLFEEALRSDENNLGPEHPSIARSRNNLATVYQALGRYTEAASLIEKALRSDENNLGSEHPSTARRRSNLATVYQDLGKYSEAASLLEEALRSAEKNFGPEHPSTAIRRSNLATVYQDLGKYSEAASLLEEALQSDEKNFGSEHPSTARSRNNLAMIYKDLGRYTEATSLLEQSLDTFIKVMGEEHPNVKIVRGNIQALEKR